MFLLLDPTSQSVAVVSDPDVAADVPRIGLEEMLRELTLQDSDGGAGVPRENKSVVFRGTGVPDEDVNMG